MVRAALNAKNGINVLNLTQINLLSNVQMDNVLLMKNIAMLEIQHVHPIYLFNALTLVYV